MKSNNYKLAVFFSVVFLFLIINVAYWQFFRASELAAHPKNRRLWDVEKQILRGQILARDGSVLAQSLGEEGNWKRSYPRGEILAHVIGYNTPNFGKSGLEAKFSGFLLGMNDVQRLYNVAQRLIGYPPQGGGLVLTIDVDLQQRGYDLLSQYERGAAVALNPETGEVLAMVSVPSFDPNFIEEDWDYLLPLETSPFLNRAIQGAYPPGSAMKVVTGASYLKNVSLHRKTFNCPGFIEVEGRRLECIEHGSVDFIEAMAVSCNTAFIEMAINAGAKNFTETAREFGFNENIPFELNVRRSTLPMEQNLTLIELAEASIGQGRVQATPFQMALVASSVANDGVLMRPFIVRSFSQAGGQITEKTNPELWSVPLSRREALTLQEAMVAVVEKGTGKNAALSGIKVAGKTGTAQNEAGMPHSWFIGFAQLDDASIAVAVVVEHGGKGGEAAALIARELFCQWLKV